LLQSIASIRLSGRCDMDSRALNQYGGPVILVVEDHRAVRQALRELLLVAFGAIEVLEAANVREALQQVTAHSVDVVLMDIRLPGVDGVTGARQVLAHSSHSEVVMVSNFDDIVHRRAAARAGAKAFVSKRAIGKELILAIEGLLAARNDDAVTNSEGEEVMEGSRHLAVAPRAMLCAGCLTWQRERSADCET
jgi:DNA-binding NarL/FixJ family response regulator